MAEVGRMGKAELFMYFTERFGVRRAVASKFHVDILAPEKETEGLLGEIEIVLGNAS